MTTDAAAQTGPTSAPLIAVIENLRQLSADPGIWATLPSSDGAAPYLPWHVVTRILDAGAPGWECETVGIHETAETVTATVKLIIGGAGRCASYQQAKIGAKRDGGTFVVSAPLEKAERRALARAAGLFGLGAEAPPRDQLRRAAAPPPRQPRNDNAKPNRPSRPADGNPNTMAMIEKLAPTPDAYTGFLRRMRGGGAGEPERRYLWAMARHNGLSFDQATEEFVRSA